MPSGPVDIVRALYDVWNDGGIEAVASRYWHEDIVWRDDPTVPDASTFSGIDAVRSHIVERVELLGNFEIVVHEVLGLGADRVLAIYTFKGAGGASGAPYEMRIGQTLRLCADLVIDVQDHLDPDAARSREEAAARHVDEA